MSWGSPTKTRVHGLKLPRWFTTMEYHVWPTCSTEKWTGSGMISSASPLVLPSKTDMRSRSSRRMAKTDLKAGEGSRQTDNSTKCSTTPQRCSDDTQSFRSHRCGTFCPRLLVQRDIPMAKTTRPSTEKWCSFQLPMNSPCRRAVSTPHVFGRQYSLVLLVAELHLI
ncbi:hypothetical protein C8Q78DRAFT_1020712 [Trametes maxima]|nr:hypothetical protein C8Q78DRAFT_1020712 [Trametes maxima]